MVLAFSGVWPYLKLLLLFRCCYCPQQTDRLSAFTRLRRARADRSLLVLAVCTSVVGGALQMTKSVWFAENTYTFLGSEVSSEVLVATALTIASVLVAFTAFEIVLRAGLRGEILHMLDAAGTCSLIDLYVLAVCILAFRIHVESPELTETTRKVYEFDVVVTPVAGLYAFIIAVCLSIFLNYVALTLHRKTLHVADDTVQHNTGRVASDKPRRLSLLDFLRSEAGEMSKADGEGQLLLGEWSSRPCIVEIQYAVRCGMLVGAVILLVGGSTMTSFEFKIYGVLQYAIDIGVEGSSLREYSLLSSIVEMGSSGDLDRFGGWPGAFFITAIYGCFSFVVPLLVLLTSTIQLLASMTVRQHEHLLVVSEALSAWSAVEVFVAAVYVGALQMAQVSGFILDHPCKSLNGYIVKALQYGIVPESIVNPRPHTNECFIIEALPREGIYVLMSAAVASFLAVRCTNRLSKRAVLARVQQQDKFSAEHVQNGLVSPMLTDESRPLASLCHNTASCAEAVVGDIEMIRSEAR